MLRLLAGNATEDFPELNKELLKRRDGQAIFSYSKELWERGEEMKASQDEALMYLTQRFTPIKKPVQYMAGFVTKSGLQLGLVRRGQEITVFVEPGDWERLVPGVVLVDCV